MVAAIEVTDLTVKYGTKIALDQLSLTIESGTVSVVVGPNGAGKTSLLEVCEGLRRPGSGQTRVLGLDPLSQRRLLRPRVGVQLQSGGVWSTARADEMLRHVAALHRHPQPLGPLIERLGLADCGRTPYRRLSGGQQQRLGLALALVGRPELVILDEPTAGMDPNVRRETWQILRELAHDGVSVVFTTHYLDEAERLAEWVHLIDHGKLMTSGSPRDLIKNFTAVSPTATREQTTPPSLEDVFFALTNSTQATAPL